MHDEATSMGLGAMLDGITLVANVFTTHVEDHSRSAAVLHSSVATELDKVGITEPRGEVVAGL